MATVYLGLGSNLGDRKKNIELALKELNQNGVAVEKMSSVIETEPVGGPRQGKFLNAAARASTLLSPQDLLITLKSIETKLGRVKTVKYGPRVIDIDILLYDNIKLKTDQLEIPHPQIFTRDFVMRPLAEIAPEVMKDLLNENHPKR